MKLMRACIAFLVITALFLPLSAAAENNKYSYITVEDVEIQLDGSTATISVDFRIDDIVSLLVFFLGKGDLKTKMDYILNFDDAKFTDLSMNHATVVVEGASYDYLDGTYWFPTHQFNIDIPTLKVISPQTYRIYNNTRLFPQGMGYFDSSPEGEVNAQITATRTYTPTQYPVYPEAPNSSVS